MRRIMMATMAMALLAEAGCGDAATAQAAATRAARQTSSAAEPSAPAPRAMQRVDIVDRLGFASPVAAGQISIPAGWRSEGGVNWDTSTPCAANQMKFQWRAVAPDGIGAIEFLPGYAWQTPDAYIQMNPCPVERVGSARDFLAMVVRAMRPGARVIGYRDRADLIAGLPAGQGYRNELGEVTITYQTRGVAVEEVLSALVSLSGSAGNAGYVIGYRAPAGRLDRTAFDRIRGSFKGNMAYARMMGQRGQNAVTRYSNQQSAAISSWHNARMAEINAKGASDRAAIRAQGNAETNAIYANTAAGTAATNDGIYDSNLRALKEEQTWTNPAGQTVQGSIHGGQRVIETNGSFTRTDDPYYNPAGSTEYTPD